MRRGGGRFRTIEWKNGCMVILDQRLLPHREKYMKIRSSAAAIEAIRTLAVRGAPAIGVAGGFASALAAMETAPLGRDEFLVKFLRRLKDIEKARPTAVNLSWAVGRIRRAARAATGERAEILKAVHSEAGKILREDACSCKLIGMSGERVIGNRARILTYCNAGALATSEYGTALAVVRAAVEKGKKVSVIACETRPILQGARLTAWELKKDGIPVRIITDGMAAYCMRAGMVDAVIVGADRIAANGDTVNKIGTYAVAIAAAAHGIPFFVAAPGSTTDLTKKSGDEIEIEMRDPDEVTHFSGARVAPKGVGAINPAFDMTPAKYITGIIMESGIARPPYRGSLSRHVRESLEAVKVKSK